MNEPPPLCTWTSRGSMRLGACDAMTERAGRDGHGDGGGRSPRWARRRWRAWRARPRTVVRRKPLRMRRVKLEHYMRPRHSTRGSHTRSSCAPDSTLRRASYFTVKRFPRGRSKRAASGRAETRSRRKTPAAASPIRHIAAHPNSVEKNCALHYVGVKRPIGTASRFRRGQFLTEHSFPWLRSSTTFTKIEQRADGADVGDRRVDGSRFPGDRHRDHRLFEALDGDHVGVLREACSASSRWTPRSSCSPSSPSRSSRAFSPRPTRSARSTRTSPRRPSSPSRTRWPRVRKLCTRRKPRLAASAAASGRQTVFTSSSLI